MSKNPTEQKLVDALTVDPVVEPAEWRRIREKLGVKARRKRLVEVSFERHDSPFGELLVAATKQGLVRVGLSAESPDQILEDLAKRISPRVLAGNVPQIKLARRQLDQYFNGTRRSFELELDWQLAHGFRRQVLDATENIPYGETRTYREVATTAGSAKAVRAAGSALAHNPLPIVIPCHRVLRTDGHVGNYLGGTPMKEQLLELERTTA